MVNNSHVKNLIKILIGAAWIDGKIQSEEGQYIRQIAEEKGVASDPEIKPLLDGLVSVEPARYDEWIKEYLGDRPSTEDYQNLIEAISGLIYSDGDVALEEARLLTKLQQVYNESESTQSGHNAILKQIQKLYRRWVDVQK